MYKRQEQVQEFSWLTHTADLKKLPQSLKVSCYCKELPIIAEQTQLISSLIIKELSAIDLAINAKAIAFLKE